MTRPIKKRNLLWLAKGSNQLTLWVKNHSPAGINWLERNSMEKYETLQNILEQAGLRQREKIELSGISGNALQIDTRGITDSNNDDILDSNDIRVIVDGADTIVSEVSEDGKIVLAKPVDQNNLIKITFYSSPIRLGWVSKVRSEVVAELVPLNICDSVLKDNKYKPKITQIIRLWAAGMLLIKEYGFNEDVAGTSKDGYKLIEMAKEKASELKKLCNQSCVTFNGKDDGDIFSKTHKISSEDW